MRSGAGSASGSGVMSAIWLTLTPLFIPLARTKMRKMSLAELLFALLLVCLVAGLVWVATLIRDLGRRTSTQLLEVADLKSRLAVGGQTQESQAAELRERLAQTQSVVEGLRSALSARQPIEEEARASLRRLENVIAGSSTRGAAGENILEEALRHLPPEMLQRDRKSTRLNSRHPSKSYDVE